MNVKGIVFLTGKNAITAVFGDERWNSFMANLAEKDKYFSNIIMSVTPIPVEKFILFLDEMCKEFFNNDRMQYLTFGKQAAQFALSSEGPYKSYLLTKDIKQYIESVLPKLWSTYFDEGVPVTRSRTMLLISKSPDFKSSIFISSTLSWVSFRRPLKCSGRKVLRKRSGVFHPAMMIFITSSNLRILDRNCLFMCHLLSLFI